jgi:hypothetical protein
MGPLGWFFRTRPWQEIFPCSYDWLGCFARFGKNARKRSSFSCYLPALFVTCEGDPLSPPEGEASQGVHPLTPISEDLVALLRLSLIEGCQSDEDGSAKCWSPGSDSSNFPQGFLQSKKGRSEKLGKFVLSIVGPQRRPFVGMIGLSVSRRSERHRILQDLHYPHEPEKNQKSLSD